ncbi:MAG: acetyl ornithine aminotransferase family protein [Acidilobaceae archaeon]|nr:acetyl ornithine aminotransferase family protein [Acidilobaceae archaeon]
MKAPLIRVTPPGPRAREIVEKDSKLLMQSFARWYPLVVKRGFNAVLEDVDGNLYIDFNSGIAVTNVGHSHPKVVEAIKAQAEKFLHYSLTDFYYELAVEAAEILTKISPVKEGKVFFTNSGTESNEAALKVARGYFKGTRPYVISFIGSFHGRTYGSMSLSASKPVHKRHFSPLVPGIIHVPFPYPYRCPFKASSPEECAEMALSFMEEWIFGRLVDPGEVSAVFFEPILGEGGYVVPPDNFLPGLERLAKKHGILLVADEVQTGFGRTGRWFACEHWGVSPDVVSLAKGISAGLPAGAIVGRGEVMSLPPGAHANTFGGNPVALAAFKASVEVLSEGYVERAARLGKEALSYLESRLSDVELVGDIRGKGFMIGVELVKSRRTKEPARKELEAVLMESFKRGVLPIGAGMSTVRIAPPLTIEEELLFTGLDIVSKVIREVGS